MSPAALIRPDLFPMARAGGLFILLVGSGVLAGGLWPRWRLALLVAAAAAATASIVLLAGRLSQRYGTPTAVQLAFLLGSIVLEIVLIRIVVAKTRAMGTRTKKLSILFVVGLHFLPMGVAFGPACALLGFALCAWSGAALRHWRELPLRWAWAADGALKIAFGSFMFFGLT